jgi:hypothetical protein
LKDVVDKIKTYARAVGSKVEDPDTDLSTKYEKEKFIERENLAGLTTTHFSLYSNFSLLTNHECSTSSAAERKKWWTRFYLPIRISSLTEDERFTIL